MKIDVLTLFPDIINAYLNESMMKRARESGHIESTVYNLRDYTQNKHRKVDDVPFGGSIGMVIQVEPVMAALKSLRKKNSCVILFSPKGKTLNMELVKQLSSKKHLILLAGHYEGFDHRIETMVDECISVGDYVLTGGELPSLSLIDALTRLQPGVLGKQASFENDSFYNGLLDWDIFTRPQNFDILSVPEVLASGNHQKIEAWKKQSALINTLRYRPDLLAKYKLSDVEKAILKTIWLEEECDE